VTAEEVAQRLRDLEVQAALRMGVFDPSGAVSPARALRELRERLERHEGVAEVRLALGASAGLHVVFHSLCRRYGVDVFRAPRQKLGSVALRQPASFIDGVLSPITQGLVHVIEAWFMEHARDVVTQLEIELASSPGPHER
jgi:hypothetical protein